MGAPCDGEPFPNPRAFSPSRSSTLASSIDAVMIFALSRTLRAVTAAAAPDTGVERLPQGARPQGRGGGPRHRRRAAAVGAQGEGRRVGVAVDDRDVLWRDAELLGDDLRERRLV